MGSIAVQLVVRQRHEMYMDKAIFISTNILSGIAHKAAAAGDADKNIVAALFSAAWVEAAVNELIHHLVTEDETAMDPALKEARRAAVAANLLESHSASIELKLRLLCATLTGKQLELGHQPWQRMFLLFELRNWLVHLRPEAMDVRPGRDDEPSMIVSSSVHKLVRALKASKAFARIPAGHLVPVVIAAGLPGVGRWSYATAYNTLEGIAKWYPRWKSRLLLTAKKPTISDAAV
jgi:hypothetical protein